MKRKNYYIDFDATLFNTPQLTKMIAKGITEKVINTIKGKTKEELDKISQELFEQYLIPEKDYYVMITETAQYYGIDETQLIAVLDGLLVDCKNLVYKDVIPVLKSLRAAGHRLYILTYCRYSFGFQLKKIIASGLMDYFDAIDITGIPKDELDIDYRNGIFIDDKLRDLHGFSKNNAGELIRMVREGNGHSEQPVGEFNRENNSSLSCREIRSFEDLIKRQQEEDLEP